ncbi:MAG TPA: TolC family protein [Candidatus Hydrogenedentes bacterium]|nr:TolC family protein [Candidatus Hydrogenedentota bacterium]HPG67317.1 TolC family protein [Candidatus Hydrogenedentota bacterium]
MHSARWLVAAVAVLIAGVALGETTSVPSDAATAEGGAAGDVARDISVDLIDLEKLREAVEGRAGRERLRISLTECVLMALDNNQDILITEFEPLKSDADIFAAKGEFDPALSMSGSYLYGEQEASPEYKRFGGIDSTEAHRTSTDTSVGGKLQWGTVYNVDFSMNKEETTWNSFIEEYSGALTLTVAQPLLRGRSRAANTAMIRIAKCGREAAEHQLRLAVMTTVAEVVKAYWDLVGATEAVKVRAGALSNAERLLEISKKRLDIGTAAAIEVLQAKAGVAVRQSDLIAARSSAIDAEDVIKYMLDMRDSDVFEARQLVPVDRPSVEDLDIEALQQREADVQQSIALAIENRPEMALSQVEIESAKLDRTRAADALLPDFSLTGSIMAGGRDHKLRQTFYGMRERSDNGYSVGFRASVPLGNRAARGSYERAEETLRQAEQRVEKTKQELALKVRLAARALSTSQILVESNRQARALQETNVVAEEKRLRLGVTTSYRVLQIQEDLTAAQVQELQAQIAYEKALVELRLAEGTILSSLGLDFEAPESKKPITFIEGVTPDWVPLPACLTKECEETPGAQ